MFATKKEKTLGCKYCGFQFSNLDVDKTCSNCFACTGCEIYICPSCKNEVVVKPVKKMNQSGDK
jgi:predicted Zn-ribbon and HTH transcriptional regulator